MFNDQTISNNTNNFGHNNDSGFGKKNNGDSAKVTGMEKETISVHAMPPKFVTATQRTGHLTTASGSKGSGRKLLLISISLILVIILVIGGVIYFVKGNNSFNFNLFSGNSTVNENTNQNTDNNTTDNNTNEVINDNTNQNTNNNINDNTNEVINENTNQNTNDNANNNINDNTNDFTDYQVATDVDNDGLTGEEEFVFGTNPDMEDTDKDGYKDGQEITSLYNPLVPVQDLFSSGLVKKFISSNFGYTILRPSSWTAKVVGTVSNIIILPDSESGESFSIKITSNQDNKTLEQVLVDGASDFGSFTEYENYSLSGVSAYRSLDGRKVLAINNGFVFFIAHQVSAFGGVSFDNIFEMMLKSFTWTAIENPDAL